MRPHISYSDKWISLYRAWVGKNIFLHVAMGVLSGA